MVTDHALREIQELHRDLASKGSGDKRLSLRREFPAIESGAQIRQEQAAHPMSYPSQANVSDLLFICSDALSPPHGVKSVAD